MPHLYTIHDPMCSWCWGFRQAHEQLLQQLPDGVSHSRLLGGLATDTDQPMPEEMRQNLQATWRRIQERVPQTRFNFDFWRLNTPRRATYPACRAVIAARALEPDREEAMILAIQQAYYLQARNPSDPTVLIELAQAIGLDPIAFENRLSKAATQQQLEEEIAQARAMGVNSFPSLVLQVGESRWPVPVDYQSAAAMLETIELILA